MVARLRGGPKTTRNGVWEGGLGRVFGCPKRELENSPLFCSRKIGPELVLSPNGTALYSLGPFDAETVKPGVGSQLSSCGGDSSHLRSAKWKAIKKRHNKQYIEQTG